MTTASRQIPCSRRPTRNIEALAPSDIAVARYVDREIDDARATAMLCTQVAGSAQAQGCALVAGLLHDFAAELNHEATLLVRAARPDVRWPRREPTPYDPADLDDALSTVAGSLRQSERVLRWISKRPDLSPSAAATFAAMSAARRARVRLLNVCTTIDSL
jgi:hypothetical protein